ncbi:TPA: hypothetical protein ACGO1T_000321 [Streptococcus suis]
MALKDEDTLMKRKRELEEAMANLGLDLNEEEEAFVDDLANQFEFDEEALKAMTKDPAADDK